MMQTCYFCGTLLGFTDDNEFLGSHPVGEGYAGVPAGSFDRVGGVVVAGERLCRSCQRKFRALKKAQDAGVRR